MEAEFSILGRKIGIKHPPLVIAEIGINHEGNLDLAIKMADAAINSGAEIIKHQTHIIEGVDQMLNVEDVIYDFRGDKSVKVEIGENHPQYIIDNQDKFKHLIK